jgi:hypothetical protein
MVNIKGQQNFELNLAPPLTNPYFDSSSFGCHWVVQRALSMGQEYAHIEICHRRI